MELPILKNAKKVWGSWNLQTFILLSLLLQTILLLFAPFRKRSNSKLMIFIIWSTYSASDWTANFVLGLITNSLPETSSGEANHVRGAILALWASFLLLHLGGSDTLTAFALEDNELWLRYLLSLIFQILASAYIFFLSLPNNKLWVPTLLVFFTGVVRCAERVRAMFLASLDHLRDSAHSKPSGSDADIISYYESRKTQTVNNQGQGDLWYTKRGELNSVEVIQCGFHLFQTFKRLIVELKISSWEKLRSVEFFQDRSAIDAFTVVEAELNFSYENLYTKTKVVNSWAGLVGRFFCFCSLVASLLIFISVEKKFILKIDIWVTYILLIGSMLHDLVSLGMLVSSDWANVRVREHKNSLTANIMKHFLLVKKRRLVQSCKEDDTGGSHLSLKSSLRPLCTILYLYPKRIILRRWSESIQQFNLINYAAHESYPKNLTGTRFVSSEPFTEKLRSFIFDTLRTRSLNGKQVSLNISEYLTYNINRLLDGQHSQNYTTTLEYDEGLLLWHIATEILYNNDKDNDHEHQDSRYFSKILSDYMMYLLLMQPTLMFSVSGMAKTRFRDTCGHIKRLPKGKSVSFPKSKDPQLSTCYSILENLNNPFPDVKRAGLLARTVIWSPSHEDGSYWVLISNVWMELLLYAANQCRAYTHAQQLSKGGELLSLVWLLATHFDLYK